MEFLKNLDSDLKSALKAQLRDLWTHTSTAIEGNTLDEFKVFCSESWEKSLALVDRAHQLQATRNEGAEIKSQ